MPELNFKVRDRHIVNRERWSERSEGGMRVREKQVDSFGAPFGRTIVQLEPGEVARHAAALEPMDAAGADELEKFHFRASPPADIVDPVTDAAMKAAAATVRALAEAGLIRLPAKKAD